MNKYSFQERQHISAAYLNGIYTDLETYLADVFGEALPLASTVISGGFGIVNDFPVASENALLFNPGVAYDSTLFRIEIDEVDGVAWTNNAAGTGNRNDIVYVQGDYVQDDFANVFFLSATGTIYQQPIYQRLDNSGFFSVAIGNQYSGAFSVTQDPVLPANVVPLARVYNHAASQYITGTTDTGSNAFAQFIGNVYPFTFEDGFTLEDLADVEISNVASGQTIRWNPVISKWVNASDLEGPPPYPFSGATSVTVTHNLGFNPLVQVENSSNTQIIPNSVTYAGDMNSFTVTFVTAQSGNIIYK